MKDFAEDVVDDVGDVVDDIAGRTFRPRGERVRGYVVCLSQGRQVHAKSSTVAYR